MTQLDDDIERRLHREQAKLAITVIAIFFGFIGALALAHYVRN